MLAALLLLSYLIGLTYIAKQETLAAVENLWPLLFLAPPLVYALAMAGTSGVGALAAALLAACVAAALWLLRRRRPGDVPRAVVTLIAGICLLDAVLIASAGAVGLAWLAIGAFALTLALQRLVPGT
jgi:4-hydroxybenzoate polyprenyltransferase